MFPYAERGQATEGTAMWGPLCLPGNPLQISTQRVTYDLSKHANVTVSKVAFLFYFQVKN